MKDKLTLNQAIEQKFTPLTCVKYYWPDYTEEQCDFVLFEQTCFPFSMTTTLDQLYELYLKEHDRKN